MMRSQWECLLENLGIWEGSFTTFSPRGEVLGETSTLVFLEGTNENQSVRQVVRQFIPTLEGKLQSEDTVLEYDSLGRGVLLFDSGAFSQGPTQLDPHAEFGAELGLIERHAAHPGDRRLRLVQVFDRHKQFSQLTLIRERRSGTQALERPPLQVEDLLGVWQGEAMTLYPDGRAPSTGRTRLQIEREGGDRLRQHLSSLDSGAMFTLTFRARIENRVLVFDQGPQPNQVLLLPDGASCTCPTQIRSGYPFFLEVGWLLRPDLRQRLIRRYDDQGEWVSLTLVTESKEMGSGGNH